jgi:hypothetical protein
MSPDVNTGRARAALGPVGPDGRSQRRPLVLNCSDRSMAGSLGSVVVGDGGRGQNPMKQHLNEVRSLD